MREGRSGVARFPPPRLLVRLCAAAASLAACASGCATEVTTLEPTDRVVAGAGGTGVPVSAAGKSTSGGSGSTGTAGTAGTAGSAGSKSVNAFGGTGSSAGAPATGGSAGAGGKAQSGTSGSGGTAGAAGGAKKGGAAGQSGQGSGGTGGTGQAGTANGGSGAGNLACLNSWKNDPCDVCSKETQSDHLACVDILDCYAANSCGPATCGANDDKCGANKISKGTAGYPIAQKVYDCLCN